MCMQWQIPWTKWPQGVVPQWTDHKLSSDALIDFKLKQKKLGGVSLSWASIIRVDHVSTRPMKPFFFSLVSNSQCLSPDQYRQTYLDMYLEFKRYHSTSAALTLIIVFRSVEIFTPKIIIPRTKFCEGKYWTLGIFFLLLNEKFKNY
jgi:hypothetical protein